MQPVRIFTPTLVSNFARLNLVVRSALMRIDVPEAAVPNESRREILMRSLERLTAQVGDMLTDRFRSR